MQHLEIKIEGSSVPSIISAKHDGNPIRANSEIEVSWSYSPTYYPLSAITQDITYGIVTLVNAVSAGTEFKCTSIVQTPYELQTENGVFVMPVLTISGATVIIEDERCNSGSNNAVFEVTPYTFTYSVDEDEYAPHFSIIDHYIHKWGCEGHTTYKNESRVYTTVFSGKPVQIGNRPMNNHGDLKWRFDLSDLDAVLAIQDQAFEGCLFLAGVTLPPELKSIGNYAFNDCPKMDSIEMPSSVVSIGEKAFYQCFGLKDVTINAKTPPVLGIQAFDRNFPSKLKPDYSFVLHVPSESVSAYKAVSGYNDYFDEIVGF